ncbi:MAG TPA: sugar phosphate isomerase/epimerase [Thermomicrobiales bacterium]|jgi:fatty-acyl-CoA synthase
MVKLAFSTLGCPDWSLDEVIAATQRYGYDGVELRLLDGEIITTELPQGERERVRTAFANAGIPICCLDSSIRVATGVEPEQVAAELRAFLALAAELGAPMIRVFGGEWPEGQAEAQVFDATAALLNSVAPDAERLGVAVVLETHDSLSSSHTVAEILRRVPSHAIGALWDSHHPYRMGEAPDQVIDALGDRILHFHVKDARRNEAARTGWDLLLLGEGEVPVRDSLTTLLRRGYTGWVAVEWEKKWHPTIEAPEVALPQHAKLLREWAG